MGSSMSVQFQKWSSTWIHKLLSTFINGIGKERMGKRQRMKEEGRDEWAEGGKGKENVRTEEKIGMKSQTKYKYKGE